MNSNPETPAGQLSFGQHNPEQSNTELADQGQPDQGQSSQMRSNQGQSDQVKTAVDLPKRGKRHHETMRDDSTTDDLWTPETLNQAIQLHRPAALRPLLQAGKTPAELGIDANGGGANTEATRGLWAIHCAQPDWPDWLNRINAPPAVIWGVGNRQALNQTCIATVGTRDPGRYGHLVAELAGTMAVKHGVGIVSGLARGCDQLGMKAGENGTVVGIIASDPRKPTPASGRGIAKTLLERGGALIAEVPPECYAPKGPTLMARNRLIAGMAKLLIPCQADWGSGTTGAIKTALEYGTPVVVAKAKTVIDKNGIVNRLIELNGQPLTREDLQKLRFSHKKVEELHQKQVAAIVAEDRDHLEQLIAEVGRQL